MGVVVGGCCGGLVLEMEATKGDANVDVHDWANGNEARLVGRMRGTIYLICKKLITGLEVVFIIYTICK